MSEYFRVQNISGNIDAEVQLPASKSESNRALIINAVSGNKSTLRNLSSAHDTLLMQQLLASAASELDTEDAGTVMRFLTAYFTVTNQPKNITGSQRMQERPLGVLVEALREIGGDIEYRGSEGYPPVQVNGIDMSWPAQEVTVSGQISSQFISALLMVAPLLPNGLKIYITTPVSSWPYISMTTRMMQYFGAIVNTEENTITVKPGLYKPVDFTVEADWSAAGYWFAIAAFAGKASISMQNLRPNSLQPDSIIVELIKHWGVETVFTKNGLVVENKGIIKPPGFLNLDFSQCPDLAQTIIVLSAATGVKLHLTGLESLKIKETDRVASLRTELKKIGAELKETNRHEWELLPTLELPVVAVQIKTYNDHRMALAFAPLSLLFPIEIENPGVVRKSYPEFWEELGKAGFNLNAC